MGLFRIPGPEEKIEQWHVAPGIDLASYAFSWVWVLIPMLLLGSDHWDYVGWYLLILALTDVHRHYNFPYVFADAEVRRRFPLRFVLFPALMFLAFASSPWLAKQALYLSTADIAAGLACVVVLVQAMNRDGEGKRDAVTRTLLPGLFVGALAMSYLGVGMGRFGAAGWWIGAALVSSTWLDVQLRRPEHEPPGDFVGRPFVGPLTILALVGAAALWGPALDASQGHHGGFRVGRVLNWVAVFALLWNVYHVYAQKFGILRMYGAKSGNKAKVHPQIDRWLVFAWVPLYFAWLGPVHEELIVDRFPKTAQSVPPFVDFLESIAWFTVPLSTAFLLAAVGVWIWQERKINGLRNWPRIFMAIGTFLLGAAFFTFDPVKVYLAFSFSHAVEYMVFVWAFQRKRYAQPMPHNPPLQRALRHPWIAYLSFTLLLSAAFLYLKYYGRFINPEAERPMFMGTRTSTWIGYYGIYQSMVHFYWDGFMWKMRKASLRRDL